MLFFNYTFLGKVVLWLDDTFRIVKQTLEFNVEIRKRFKEFCHAEMGKKKNCGFFASICVF